jgi:geranylgeranyl pyrophosphate synthase
MSLDNPVDLPKWSMPHREALLNRLRECFSHEDSRLHDACLYPIETGGKRIRPLFLFAGLEALNKPVTSDAYTTAAAIELIHTYSLVHDDLPCMDDDDERRGKPTVHRAYNEGIAVLVGDALLTKAFEILADTNPIHVGNLVRLLGKAAGSVGMIGGQSLDIGFEGSVDSIERLTLLHRRKTGALIEVSLEMAAVLAEATPSQRDALSQFGRHIGLAFQLADDILDAEEDAEENGPPSFVKLLGHAETAKAAADAMNNALLALKALPNPNALRCLAEFTVNRTY